MGCYFTLELPRSDPPHYCLECCVAIPNLNEEGVAIATENAHTHVRICLPAGVVVCTIPVVMLPSLVELVDFLLSGPLIFPGRGGGWQKNMLREIDFQRSSRFSIIDFLITTLDAAVLNHSN